MLKRLKRVVLNEGLEVIEDSVFEIFYGNQIKEITFPSTLKKVPMSTFNNSNTL